MKRSKRMEVIEGIIQQQENRAARALALARNQLGEEESKLLELNNYLADYEKNMLSQGGQGVTGQQWQNFQYFIGQLEKVIQHQHQSIEQAENQLQKIQQRWQQIHIKRKSISTLVENIRLEEWVVEEKKEQKELDELVNQLQIRD